MREKSVDETPAAAATEPNPWQDRDPEPIIDLVGGRGQIATDERANQYNEWAERMRQKRQRNRDLINGSKTQTGRSTYWTADALFADSKMVEQEELTERPNPWRARELLSMLDLDANAEASEIGEAYRKLAKAHHPDRFVTADPETQQFHADKMTTINKAYRALKELQRV